MSDLLSELLVDQSRFPGNMTYAHNAAINAAREFLRSDAVSNRLWDAVDDVVTVQVEVGTVSRQEIVDAVVAALAGDDDA